MSRPARYTSAATVEAAVNEVFDKQYKLLGAKMVINSPHLAIVLVNRGTEHEPYVTWLYNIDGGLGLGHYFNNLENALEDFNKRN